MVDIKLAIKSSLKSFGVLVGVIFSALGILWVLQWLSDLPSETGLKVVIGIMFVVFILVGSVFALVFYDVGKKKKLGEG